MARKQSDGAQPVAEAYISRGQQDAQSGSARVRLGSARSVVQLQMEVEQHKTQELFDLVDGEESPGTHGGTRSEGHQEVLQPPSVLVEVRLFVAVLDVAVEAERLTEQGQHGRLGGTTTGIYRSQ